MVCGVLLRRSFLDGGVGLFEASLQQDRAGGQAGLQRAPEALLHLAALPFWPE